MTSNTNFKFNNMEKEVIEFLKFGCTNPEIAKKLNVSTHTVKYHISSIIRKTNAVNRINAVFILGLNGYFDNCEQEILQPQELH